MQLSLNRTGACAPKPSRRIIGFLSRIRRLALLLFIASSPFVESALAAFSISAQTNCLENGVYPYRFVAAAANPDFSVQVSQSTVLPDVTFKLVNNRGEADLILADDLNIANMKVCKTNSAAGTRTIVITDATFRPDVKVALSESPFLPDYTIFVQSDSFTNEEAAALFAVIWKVNKELL